MTEKPSRNEDEYFAKREAEILRARREAAAKAEQDAERRSHYMRCPKCGGHLATEEYHGIQVDRCPDCLGTWFDAGEAEQLMKAETGGAFNRVFAALVRGVKATGKATGPA